MIYRFVLSIIISVILVYRGIKKSSLTKSGAIAAFMVGVLSVTSGYGFGILLFGFYASSTKLTKIKQKWKREIGAGYENLQGRSSSQVLACSILGVLIACAYSIFVGEEAAIDFRRSPLGSFLICCYIGHYSCCNADTWASEIGVFSESNPVLITSPFRCKRVPKGTNGAISWIGTIASFLGGLFIGALFYGYCVFFLASSWRNQYHCLTLGSIAGVFGSMLDSLLGATIQSTWYDEKRKQIIEEPSAPKKHEKHICGYNILTNEQINILSVLLTTIFSGFLSQYMLFNY